MITSPTMTCPATESRSHCSHPQPRFDLGQKKIQDVQFFLQFVVLELVCVKRIDWIWMCICWKYAKHGNLFGFKTI